VTFKGMHIFTQPGVHLHADKCENAGDRIGVFRHKPMIHMVL